MEKKLVQKLWPFSLTEAVILLVEYQLSDLGYDPGPIDGTLDVKTQQALRDFQKANKLPVTGVLDAQTAEKLGVTMEKGAIPGRAPGGSSLPKDSPMPKR